MGSPRVWLSVMCSRAKNRELRRPGHKAADAGYKLIIVLAGMHNVLRQQTQ